MALHKQICFGKPFDNPFDAVGKKSAKPNKRGSKFIARFVVYAIDGIRFHASTHIIVVFNRNTYRSENKYFDQKHGSSQRAQHGM
jgi:hypothetical protein